MGRSTRAALSKTKPATGPCSELCCPTSSPDVAKTRQHTGRNEVFIALYLILLPGRAHCTGTGGDGGASRRRGVAAPAAPVGRGIIPATSCSSGCYCQNNNKLGGNAGCHSGPRGSGDYGVRLGDGSSGGHVVKGSLHLDLELPLHVVG